MKQKINLGKVGNRIPFTVPENYFEQFATQFEARLEQHKPRHKFMHVWMYAAAMVLGVVFLSRMAYVNYSDNKTETAENYELYVMTQVNDLENIDYNMPEITENNK